MSSAWIDRILRLWERLVEPPARITRPEDRHGARLFAILLLVHVGVVLSVLAVWNCVSVAVLGRPIWRDLDVLVMLVCAALMALTYGLLRTGRYRPSVALYILISAAMPLTAPFMPDPNAQIGELGMALIPPLLASYIYSSRWVAGILAGTVGLAVVRLLTAPLPAGSIKTGFIILICVLDAGVLIIVSRRRFTILERARLDRLRESETALEESTERFRVLLDSSLDVLLGADRGGFITYIGGAFEAATGYTVAERMGRSIFDHILPADVRRVRGEFDNLLVDRAKELRTEWRQAHKDGRTIWFEALATNRLGYLGLDSLVVSLRDVSARRRAEEDLEQGEQKYRRLFESVADAILILGADGRVLEVNEGACRQLGYTREELLRMNIEDYAPDMEEHMKSRARVVLDGSGTFETRHRRKDGTFVPVDLAVARLTYQGDMAFLGVARDVTARHQAAAERALLESQVQQAARMETVGRLAGGVAHDFNNLLGVILGNINMIEHAMAPGAPQQKRLGDLRRASQSAALLVRHLLAFSRREAITPRITDLNAEIAELHRMLEGLAGEAIVVAVVPGLQLGTVHIDPGMIERTIVNLVANARDAMPDGGTITITTENAELDASRAAAHPGATAGPCVLLTVSDTGAGMTAEVKARLFEPFFTTKPRTYGTGLGLSTVYGAIRQAGGWIDVDSEPGKGSTFRVCLPRIADPVPAHVPAASTEAAAEQGGRETILYAEDDAPLREVTAEHLTSLGYRVLAAGNGAAALDLAARHDGRIDLLFTDTVMPGMSGVRLAAILAESRPETPGLYTSGYAEDGVPDGKLDFIPKPYDPSVLAARIRKVLDAPKA